MAFIMPKSKTKKLNPIPKAVLLQYVGVPRITIAKTLNVSVHRLLQSVDYHGLGDKFKRRAVSSFVVPYQNITVEDVSKFYGKSITEAAKALEVPYGTLRAGIKRKGLIDKFAGEAMLFDCCICHKTKVENRYTMCEACKRPEAADEEASNVTLRKVKDLPPIPCKVIKPGSREFERIAAQCTPILEIESERKLPFLDRFN
jgi:hypothetical protein